MLILPEWLSVLMPSLVVAGIWIAIVPFFSATNRVARLVLFALGVFFSIRYLDWRFTETLPPPGLNWDVLASWSFAMIEGITVISSLSAFVILSRHKDRTPEADANMDWYEAKPPSIAVLIATYNEEWSVLERTIAGAQACSWPNKRIYVLDDGRRDWLGERCGRLGVEHVTRPDNRHSKAGNINHMLEKLRASGDQPDFVAVLDADFVPHRDFLTRTLALFHDPETGLVQTPQHFFNPDPIQHNLGISRSYPDEQRFFFDYMQPARDAWGIAVCCGTSSIVRWSALDAIGDFPTSSVTEDYLLTAKLKLHGFSTVYLNEALSEGLAPEGLKEYITQRARWGLGLMQIAHGEAGPLSAKKLRWRDRWGIVDSWLYWLTAFAFRISCIVYPLLYWYFGVIVVNADINGILAHFVPYYLASMLFMNFVSRGMFVPLINDISQLVGAWEISRAAVIGWLRPHGHEFKVTMKGGDRNTVIIHWTIMRRFVILFVLTLFGLLIGLLSDYAFDAHAGEGKSVILFWSVYNLLVLAGTILVCIDLPRTASILRSNPEQIKITSSLGERQAWLVDVHQEAMRLRGIDLPVGSSFFATIPEVGSVEGVVTGVVGATLDARLDLSFDERERLIGKLHTKAGAPGTGVVAAASLGAGLIRRVIAGSIR